MTDPQLPPPYGAVPPVPAAPPLPPVPQAPPADLTYPAAPPGAYPAPVGGHSAPAGTYANPAYAQPDVVGKKSSLTGVLALVFALIAAVVTPIIAGIAGFEIGQRLPAGLDTSDPDVLALLSPARDQVLWAEIAFWAGTVLGIAAIVVGIIAIRKKQGRGLGITALVLAVLGAGIFWIALVVAISVGTATGYAV